MKNHIFPKKDLIFRFKYKFSRLQKVSNSEVASKLDIQLYFVYLVSNHVEKQ